MIAENKKAKGSASEIFVSSCEIIAEFKKKKQTKTKSIKMLDILRKLHVKEEPHLLQMQPVPNHQIRIFSVMGDV